MKLRKAKSEKFFVVKSGELTYIYHDDIDTLHDEWGDILTADRFPTKEAAEQCIRNLHGETEHYAHLKVEKVTVSTYYEAKEV